MKIPARAFAFAGALLAGVLIAGGAAAVTPPAAPTPPPLGLPPVPVPADNPQSRAKVELGDKLFHDTRFSTTGKVSCATCHDLAKALTDSPRRVSEGIDKLTGTRNAPTVWNAAYATSLFWDGRSPSLEDQALHPFINPVEMGLKDHKPILDVVQNDAEYAKAFQAVFGKSGAAITMKEVTAAIAAFERTKVSGNSPFDRWRYGADAKALNASQIRGFELFTGKARCNSCHLVEETQATFTDNRFHNIGIGITAVQNDVPALAQAFLRADASLAQVDVVVLTDKRTSELGRFAVQRTFDGLGAFKTPTLRNIALTAPYMHDGSLRTLKEVVQHYNNGGVTKKTDRVNDFLSSGIRPLGLTNAEIADLVAFMEALTSPEAQSAQSAQSAKSTKAATSAPSGTK